MAIMMSTSTLGTNASSEEEISLEMEPLFDHKSVTPSVSQNNEFLIHKRKKYAVPKDETLKIECATDKGHIPNIGLIMAVGSCLMFSLCSLIVKILNHIPFSELAAFRFVGVLLPNLPVIIRQGNSPFPFGKRIMLVLRSILGTAALLLQFYAFQHMPLADASVIVFSSPVFVSIFARIFLKESCGAFQACLIFITISGVVLITKPPWLFGTLKDGYTSDEWKGAIAAFIGTIVSANVYVTLRLLKDVHFSVSLMSFSLIALLITTSLTSFTNPIIPSCGKTRWLIICIGIFSYGGQILKTKALQVEEAGSVAIARTSDVIFSFIWQFLFFGEMPDTLTIIGAVLVTSSVVLLGLRKWVLSKPKKSNIRRIFFFITW